MSDRECITHNAYTRFKFGAQRPKFDHVAAAVSAPTVQITNNYITLSKNLPLITVDSI